MARKSQPATTGLAFDVADEGFPTSERGRTESPILTLAALEYSRDNGKAVKIRISASGMADAKEIENDARRGAVKLGTGVKVKVSPTDSDVVYLTVANKRAVNYSVADIRDWAHGTPEVAQWAADNGVDLDSGKLDKRVREAYKQAHGLVKESK